MKPESRAKFRSISTPTVATALFKRGFRVPFVPVVPILAALSCLWLMLNLEVETWLRFLIWMAIGVVLYFVYGRSHSMMGRPRPEAHKHLNVTQIAA